MDADSPYDHLMWRRGEARIGDFSCSSRGGRTVMRIELIVTTPWALADVSRDLMELKATGQAKPPRATPRRSS